MICHICKDKVATIRLKEIINNVVTELNLCQECYDAREQQGKAGLMDDISGTNLDSLVEEEKKKAKGKSRSKRCPGCGLSEEQFRARGRLGCGECYRVFTKTLEPILAKVHGSTEHRGKIPQEAARRLDLKTELRKLQEDLQRAILAENYERAAKLRDKIKQFGKI